MSEKDAERDRVEEWLTQGRPRAIIRTRGAVRTRGAPALAPALTIRQVDELLNRLKEEVRDVPWVVVVDGNLGAFVERVCLLVKSTAPRWRLSLIGPPQETSGTGALAALSPLQLNPADDSDQRFIGNLVADLAIVPMEPSRSQGERMRRWLSQARYIATDALPSALMEELRAREVAAMARATVYVTTSRQ